MIKPTPLQLFASPLAAENAFIKASFGGFAGSGKSRTATEFIIGCYKELKIEKPLLIIDNEKGSRFLIPIFKNAGVETYVKDTVYLADVVQAFSMLNSGEIGFLFIDSLSKVWYQFVRDYKKANGNKTFMTLQDWGKILPDWQEKFSDRYVNLNGNCAFTGRGGYTYEVEENEETHKKEYTKSGVKMKLAGETPFEPDLNVWMELCQEMHEGKPVVWREAQIMKDRSGLIDGCTFKQPTYNDFAPVVRFIIDTPKGEVAKSTTNNSMPPTENWEAQNRRDAREIELEKVKALFDKQGFGTSKEDKQLKIAITEKVFNTLSMTEIEKKPLEQLTKCRINLETLFSAWPSGEFAAKMEYINGFKLSFLEEVK